MGNVDINTKDELLIRKITKEFNTALTFDPSDSRMAYVIRDPVAKGMGMNNKVDHLHLIIAISE